MSPTVPCCANPSKIAKIYNWTCDLHNIQSHGNSLVRCFCFRALSAEVAAPFTIEERDALTRGVLLTRLLACREVGDFARRLAPVDLTSAVVTFGVGADIRPRILYTYRVG